MSDERKTAGHPQAEPVPEPAPEPKISHEWYATWEGGTHLAEVDGELYEHGDRVKVTRDASKRLGAVPGFSIEEVEVKKEETA